MADLPITGLPVATTLTGIEPLPVVQGGATKQSILEDVRDLIVKQRHAIILAAINIAPIQLGWLLTLNSATANATLSLTAAAFGPLFNVIIKNIWSAPLTVTPQVGDTIEGQTGAYTLFPGDSIRIVSDGITNFEIVSAVGSDVKTRTLTDIPTGYSIVPTDLDATLQMTGPGPLNAVLFKSTATAALVGRGWAVTVKANGFTLDIEPFGADTIEGVPNGDGFCIPANSSVTLVSDGISNFIVEVDGGQRLSKTVTHLAQAVDFVFAGLFSIAQVSTTVVGVKAQLQVVGGYENDRFIAGDRASVTNVGTNAFDLTTNSGVLIKTIAPNEKVDLGCLTIPVAAGDGTWEATSSTPDGTSNKGFFIGANQLDISGSDGAGKRTFPPSTDTTVYFATEVDKACRFELQVPADYDPSGGNPLNLQAFFSPETASVGKFARLQLQRTHFRAGSGDTIGGVPSTSLGTQVVPAIANEFVGGTIYSFTIVGVLAGDNLSFKYSRIGTDVLDDYDAGIQLTGLKFTY